MKTWDTSLPTWISSDVASDLEEIARHTTPDNPPDPALVRRIRERAQQARDAEERIFGIQDIGVSIIRELRGDPCGS